MISYPGLELSQKLHIGNILEKTACSFEGADFGQRGHSTACRYHRDRQLTAPHRPHQGRLQTQIILQLLLKIHFGGKNQVGDSFSISKAFESTLLLLLIYNPKNGS